MKSAELEDVVPIILAFSKTWISETKQRKLLLNIGGPDRVSRVRMAETVADLRVHPGVMSPADISMDITKLVQTLGISPISF